MPGDNGELRGLARSIDALFEHAGTRTGVQEEESPELPSSDPGEELDHSWIVEPEAPFGEEPQLDVLPGIEAERPVDAVEPTPSTEPPESVFEAAAVEPEEAPSAALDEHGDPTGSLPLEEPVDDLADAAWESSDLEGVADSRTEADPDEFERTVEGFLSGDRGLADEVRSLAAPLRERLALDPVADAVERLVESAGDPPDAAALELAGDIINPAVASRIVQRIGREHDVAKRAEYEVLCKRIGQPMAEALRGALSDAADRHARRAHYDMLIAMGDASRPVIEDMIEDDNRFLVRNAVAILGEIGGDRATELVTSALANTDPRVRREALLSLAKLGGEDADQLVVALLEDTDQSVRTAAVTAAGELGVARAVRPLQAMLEGEQDAAIVVPVLGALGQIGDPGAVPLIEKRAVRTLLSKPPTPIRIAAYRALARIGTPHAQDLIRAALDDKDAEVAAAARHLSRPN